MKTVPLKSKPGSRTTGEKKASKTCQKTVPKSWFSGSSEGLGGCEHPEIPGAAPKALPGPSWAASEFVLGAQMGVLGANMGACGSLSGARIRAQVVAPNTVGLLNLSAPSFF